MHILRWLVAIAVLGVWGCKSAGSTDAASNREGGSSSMPQSPESAGSQESAQSGSVNRGGADVTPMAGVGAGPMAPVTGAENIQGGGSGTGQVMKDRARGLAGQSPSTINQMGDD